MSIPEDTQHIYEQLALQCQRRNETLQRDLFLVLAADSAHTLGRAGHAQRLHRQLLQLSPSTMLRPFASFAEALDSGDVRAYVSDLRQQYPPETAAQMLEAHSGNQPSALFDDTTESDFAVSMTESSSPFGEGNFARPAEVSLRRNLAPSISIPPVSSATVESPAPQTERRQRLSPSLHIPEPARPDAVDPSVAAPSSSQPSKPRRRSPYEDPDFGPKIPTATPRNEEDAGIWFIHVLAGLLALAGIGVAAYVFVRPFLVR